MTKLDPPAERACQRCGRRDAWDDDTQSWRIREDAHAGTPYCIHEWDINGTYLPIQE